MLEEILPSCVAVAATQGEILEDGLFAEEAAGVEQAVEGRRNEFTTGRACARRALSRLGEEPCAIPTGAGGAPRWPEGIVGSITHCAGFRACAVARSGDLLTLGVDAEPNEPLPRGLIDDVALPRELRWIQGMGRGAETQWDRLLFSVKESVYKAWFPLAGRWLGFEDAVVTLDPARRTFSARLLVPGPVLESGEVTGFSGRWLVRDGLVLSAIAVPADRGGF